MASALCLLLLIGALATLAARPVTVILLIESEHVVYANNALRSLLGPDHRLLLPTSALCGAAFLVTCDTLAQVVFRPAVLPVGVLTACIGAPFFVGLLLSRGLRARLWS